MHKLIKISKIDKYRCFNNFSWEKESKDCMTFDSLNIIYGWNGSGKTTLCDLFYGIESHFQQDKEFKPDVVFQLTFQKNNQASQEISRKKMDDIPTNFIVFHKKYIEENIVLNKPKHLFIIGEKQKNNTDNLDSLQKQLTELNAEISQKTNLKKTKDNEFDSFKIESAAIIKNTLSYGSSYHKNSFSNSLEKLHEKYGNNIKSLILSDDDEKNKLLAIRGTTKELLDLIPHLHPINQDSIVNILSSSPSFQAIEEFIANSELNSWAQMGLDLHQKMKTNTCKFCENPISADRLKQLENHFNDEYNKLIKQIECEITNLNERKSYLNGLKNKLIDEARIYDEYKQDYINAKNETITDIEKHTSIIDSYIKLLNEKKNKITNTDLTERFKEIIPETKDFSKINKIIEANNKKTNDFKAMCNQCKKELEGHYLAQKSDLYYQLVQDNKCLENELLNLNEKKEKYTKDIIELEHKIKNSQIPADYINNDMAVLMGRDNFKFINKNDGYEICRDGIPADDLSRGEQNAIALIYFFNSLDQIGVNPKETIVVLDDPISSFDSNFYYSAISYIKNKIETLSIGQLFIFTHKFSLFKDYQRIFEGKIRQYILERTKNNAPRLLSSDKSLNNYNDEYTYLFRKIYNFVQNPYDEKNDIYQYPNMARRLLEAFLAFKIPNSNCLHEKIAKLRLEKPFNLLRLIHEDSHLNKIPNQELYYDCPTPENTKALLADILNFVKDNDLIHYEILESICTESNENNQVNICTARKKRTIPLYDLAVAAGTGNEIISDQYEDYSTDNYDCNFAVRIDGNSMEPKIYDKDTVLVKKCTLEECNTGDMIIIAIDNKGYCKKFIKDKHLLVSENKKYDQIELKEHKYETIKIYGKVVQIIPK